MNIEEAEKAVRKKGFKHYKSVGYSKYYRRRTSTRGFELLTLEQDDDGDAFIQGEDADEFLESI
jgi:hypothetical protein